MKVSLKLLKGQSLTSPTGLRVFKNKPVVTEDANEISYFKNHPDVNVTVIREKGRPSKAVAEALNEKETAEPGPGDIRPKKRLKKVAGKKVATKKRKKKTLRKT